MDIVNMPLEAVPDDDVAMECDKRSDMEEVADTALQTDSVNNKNEQAVQCTGRPEKEDGGHTSVASKVSAVSSGRRQLHSCSSCSRTFSTKRDLVTHQYMHRENPKLTCEECSKMFTTEATYTRHMRSHKRKTVGAGSNNGAARRREFTCHQCHAVFDSRKQLASHHTAKHVDEKRFICDICGSQFAWPENLRAHKQSHEVNPHECDKCGRRFVDATSLRVHTRNNHGPDSAPLAPRKVFACELCGRAFQFDFSLRAHMKGHAQSPANAQRVQTVTTSLSSEKPLITKPQYIQVDQEGIIDLGLMAGTPDGTNEIIIEVYNYGNQEEDVTASSGNENGKDMKLIEQQKEEDEKNGFGSEVTDGLPDVSAAETCSQNHSFSDTVVHADEGSNSNPPNSGITNAFNPVSIDESGMCITVSAEALPKLLDMDVSKPAESAIEEKNVEGSQLEAEMLLQSADINSGVHVIDSGTNIPCTGVATLNNTGLVWYAPPQSTDDQNAMIVWYQQQHPVTASSYENELSSGSSSVEQTQFTWIQCPSDKPVEYDDPSQKSTIDETVAENSWKVDPNSVGLIQQAVIKENEQNAVNGSNTAATDTLNQEDHEIPMATGSPTVQPNGRVTLPLISRRGRKSRPREPFMFNCVMTSEKPFICSMCGEAFRWEISLNVHLREHTVGQLPNQAGRGNRASSRSRSRAAAPARRTGVRIMLNSQVKNNSAGNSRKSRSPVGRSRIVPRTAASDEEDEEDEFAFHVTPDEETSPQQLRLNESRALIHNETPVGRNLRSGTRGLRGRGFGPRRRGAIPLAVSAVCSEQNKTVDDAVGSATVTDDQKISEAVSDSETKLTAAGDICSAENFSCNLASARDNVAANIIQFIVPAAPLYVHDGGSVQPGSQEVSAGVAVIEEINLLDLVSSGEPMVSIPKDTLPDMHCLSSAFAASSTSDPSSTDVLTVIPNELTEPVAHASEVMTSSAVHGDFYSVNKMSQQCDSSSSKSSIFFKQLNARSKWLKHRDAMFRKCIVCMTCNRLLTTLTAVHRHRRSHALAGNGQWHNVACTSCPAFFSSRWDLLLHQRTCCAVHGLPCRSCGRVFSGKLLLAKHQRMHVPKVPSSKCTYCGKRFFSTEKCRIHQSLHTVN